MAPKISVIGMEFVADAKTSDFHLGIGRLGLCAALCLEKKGFEVVGVDVFTTYVDQINAKTFVSDEPHVTDMLKVL